MSNIDKPPPPPGRPINNNNNNNNSLISDNNVSNNQPPPPTNPRPISISRSTNPFDENEIESTDEDINTYTNKPNHSNSFDQIDKRKQRSASITITPFSQQSIDYYNQDISKTQLLNQLNKNDNSNKISIIDDNKPTMKYIQLYNIDGDPFYLDVTFATVWWLLPDDIDFNDIIIISHEHFDENDYRSLYYEYIDSNNNNHKIVSWDPPYEYLSNESIIMLHDVINMNRKDIERLTNQLFNHELSENLLIKLEEFLLEKEENAELEETSIDNELTNDFTNEVDHNKIDSKRNSLTVSNESSRRNSFIISNLDSYIDSERSSSTDDNMDSPIDNQFDDKINSQIDREVDSPIDSKTDIKRSTSILNERSDSYKSFNNQSINQLSTVLSKNDSNSNRNNSITRRLNTLDSLVSKLFKSIDFSDDESDDQEGNKVTTSNNNKETLESIDIHLEKPIDSHTDISVDNQSDSQIDKQVDAQSVGRTENQLSNQVDNETVLSSNNLINELTNQNSQLVNQINELQKYILEIQSNIPDSNIYLSNQSTNYQIISNHIITSIQQLITNKQTNEQEINTLESKLSDQLIYYNTKLTNESNINKQLNNQIKQLNELVNQLENKNQSLDKQINNLQYQLDKQLDINISTSPMVTTTKPNRFSFLLDKSIDTSNELSNEMKASDTTRSSNNLINDQIVELKKQVNELTNQLSNLTIQHRKQIDINKKLSIDKDITTTLSDYPINQLNNQSSNPMTTLDSTNYLRRNIYLTNYLSSYPINYLSNHLSNKLLNYLSIPLTQFFPLELTLADYIHRILAILSYAIREVIVISNNSNNYTEFHTVDRYIDILYNDLTITLDMQTNCLYIYQWIRYVNILDSVIDSGRLIDLNHLFHTVKQLLHQLIAYTTDKPVRRLSHAKSDSKAENKSDNKLDSKIDSNIDSKIDNKLDKKHESIHLAITVLSQLENQYNYHMEFKDKRMYTYGWLYERAIDKEPSSNFPQELITIAKQSNINTRRNSIRRDSSYNYQSNESNKLATSNSNSSINHSLDSISNYQSLNKSSDSHLDHMSNYPSVGQLPTNSPPYLSNSVTVNPTINFSNLSTNLSSNPITPSPNRLDSKVDTIVLESLRAKLIASLSSKEIATTKLVIRIVSLYQAISKIASSFNNKLDSKLDSQLDSQIDSQLDETIDGNESYRKIISKFHSKLLNTLVQLDMIVKPTSRETVNLSNYQSYDWYMNHYQLASNHKLLKQSLAIIESYQLSSYSSTESSNYLSNQLTNNLTTVDSNNYQDVVSLHTRLQQLLQPIDINEYVEIIRYIDISNLSNTLFYHVNAFDNQCIASLVITIQSSQIVKYLIDLFDNLIVKTSTNEFIPLNQLDISKLDLSDTRSLRSFGFPSNVLIMSNSFTNDEILLAQYPLNELIGISFNVKQLHLSGYTVKDCKSINIDIQDIRNGGYTDYDLITSKCYQWNELLNHGIDIQRYILTDLYMKCNGKYWKRKLNWNTHYPLSTWQGVHINGRGYVYKLDLKSNHLTGYIPDSLYLLKHLEYLDISYNLLYGNIDSNIKYLKQLKDLFINNSKLNINATTRPMLQAYLPKCCIRM